MQKISKQRRFSWIILFHGLEMHSSLWTGFVTCWTFEISMSQKNGAFWSPVEIVVGGLLGGEFRAQKTNFLGSCLGETFLLWLDGMANTGPCDSSDKAMASVIFLFDFSIDFALVLFWSIICISTVIWPDILHLRKFLSFVNFLLFFY